MEGNVTHLHTRLSRQESFGQLVGSWILSGEAEEVVGCCLLVLVGFFLHLAHQSVEDIIDTCYRQLSQHIRDGLHEDGGREFGSLETDFPIANA